jgi:hypothetical protein
MNAFIPALLFCSLLYAVMVAAHGRGDILQAVSTWNNQDIVVKVIEIAGFLAGVLVFSGLIASQWTNLVRLYEGYWSFPLGSKLKEWGSQRHQARRDNMYQYRTDATSELIYRRYPPEGHEKHMMPTTFGNIVKAGELYACDRFYIETVLIWPRLYVLLPERAIQLIADARSSIDFMLVYSALAGLFSVVSGVYLLVVGATWWLFVLCFWGALFVAWLTYRGAVSTALLYTDQLRVTFDLYRTSVLQQMRLPVPGTVEEERATWQKLQRFLYRNDLPPEKFVDTQIEAELKVKMKVNENGAANPTTSA